MTNLSIESKADTTALMLIDSERDRYGHGWL